MIALYQHFSCNIDNIGVFYPRSRPCLNPGPSTGSHIMRQDIKNIAVEDVVLWTGNPREPNTASVQDQDLAVMPGSFGLRRQGRGVRDSLVSRSTEDPGQSVSRRGIRCGRPY